MPSEERGPAGDPVRPVFVLSLPRSGSTLVQRVLSAHPGVATAPEPWILLPLLYTRRRAGVVAEYDHPTLVATLDDLAARLPGGEGELRQQLADTARRLYAAAADPGDRWFVDKTPRYHLVADELVELFPDAVFVFLWRNPLAVVASILHTWYGGHWYLNRHARDLYEGLPNLVAAADRAPPGTVEVRYEDLVASSAEWHRLTDALGLDLDPGVLERLDQHTLPGTAGDPDQAAAGSVVRTSSDAWVAAFDSPLRRRWARRYLDQVSAHLERIGYDPADLRARLADAPRGIHNLPRDLWDRARERTRAEVRAVQRGRSATHEPSGLRPSRARAGGSRAGGPERSS